VKPLTFDARAPQRYHQLLQLMGISDRMTHMGWAVDRDALEVHKAGALRNIERFTDAFLTYSGLDGDALGASGAGQTDAVRDWFFIERAAPVVCRDKRTKRPQLNTPALIEYATRFATSAYGPAAASLYGLRKNKKIAEFCRAYDVLSADDGRIHASFFPYGTQTGRWSSAARKQVCFPDGSRKSYGCNLQQVPSKEPTYDFGDGAGPVKLVNSMRDIFLADPGCKVISLDYDQLELRLIAYVYGVQKLIGWIESGQDPHVLNAVALFAESRLPATFTKADKQYAKFREAAKGCAYSISYMMADTSGHNKYSTMFKSLKQSFPGMSPELAPLLAERFFALHPEIKSGQLAVRALIDQEGYQELAISGRRVYYPASMRGYNQALNFTMQGTGAELINRAMIAAAPMLNWVLGGSYFLGQIHDELVLNVPAERADEFGNIVASAMAAPFELCGRTCRIPAKFAVGDTWSK
jgi:DNA polymerase I-like protein with 3'-5' exonuclease and polymerase domains